MSSDDTASGAGTGWDDDPAAPSHSFDPFPGGDDRQTAPRRPRVLVVSAALWAVVVLVLAISAVTAALFADSFIEPLTEEGTATGVSADEARAAAEMGTWLAIGVMFVVVVLMALCAMYLWAGRGWARILLSVVGLLSVLPAAVALAAGAVNVPLLFGSAVVLVAAVLMWARPVTEYLSTAKDARRA